MKKWALYIGLGLVVLILIVLYLGTCSPVTTAASNLPTSGLPDWQVAMVTAAPYLVWIFMGIAGIATVSYIATHWKG